VISSWGGQCESVDEIGRSDRQLREVGGWHM
jgi:hypothetical protein